MLAELVLPASGKQEMARNAALAVQPPLTFGELFISAYTSVNKVPDRRREWW